MSRYTSNKNAYGISDRSGFRYRLREMKKEWNGLLVGPDEYEPKHPQLSPSKPPIDPQSLKEPRPEADLSEQRSIQHGWDPVGFKNISGITPTDNLAPTGEIGEVTVTTS